MLRSYHVEMNSDTVIGSVCLFVMIVLLLLVVLGVLLSPSCSLTLIGDIGGDDKAMKNVGTEGFVSVSVLSENLPICVIYAM